VAYSSSVIPEKWRFLYGLNPMAGVIEGFRWALLGTAWNPGHIIIVSSIIVVILFTGGLFFFRHMEKTMADVL
jgi:lipopolysaccharide transport system permease protein